METEDMCIYCYSLVTDVTIVPAPDDDEMWETIAAEHHPECEWILTRAHWLAK